MTEVIWMKIRPINKVKGNNRPPQAEKPVSKVYPVIDNDLARDNVENDIPAADLEDL